MAGTNGEPYPSDPTDVPDPPGSGDTFESSFDDYRRYEEPVPDRGWSVVDVTPSYEHEANDRGHEAPRTPPTISAAHRRPTPGKNQSNGNIGLIATIGGVALLAVFAALVLSVMAYSGSRNGDSNDIAANGLVGEQNKTTQQIQQTLQSLGITGVLVQQQDQTIYLSGTVASEDQRRIATSAALSLVGTLSLDPTGLTLAGAGDSGGSATAVDPAGPASDAALAQNGNPLQKEINQITGLRPIIFETAQTSLSATHLEILELVAESIRKYPTASLTIVGASDSEGSAESNQRISLERAKAVETQLISSGVNASQLSIDARGEANSSGSAANGAIERRVEFEVAPIAGVAASPATGDKFRIGVVSPSALDDLAFSQSMVAALERLNEARGDLEVNYTPSTFAPDEVQAALQGYAEQEYDLVVAHSSGYGNIIREVVTANPDTTFAWGDSSDNFNLPNLYSYNVASEEGGYVLGVMAANLSQSNKIGLIGPIKDAGDGTPYLNGFARGAIAETKAEVFFNYTGSYGDPAGAKRFAHQYIDSGADVLSGSAEQFTGAVEAATEKGNVLWFGNQVDQSEVNPSIVVASQVYHWEVIMQEITDDIDSGNPVGTRLTMNLANNGLTIEYNTSFTGVSDTVKQRADEVANQIRTGALKVSKEDP